MKTPLAAALMAWTLLVAPTAHLVMKSTSSRSSSLFERAQRLKQSSELLTQEGDSLAFDTDLVEILFEVELCIDGGRQSVLAKIDQANKKLNGLATNANARQRRWLDEAHYYLDITEGWINSPTVSESTFTPAGHVLPPDDLALLVVLAQARLRTQNNYFDVNARTWRLADILADQASNSKLKNLAWNRLYFNRSSDLISKEAELDRICNLNAIAPIEVTSLMQDFLEIRDKWNTSHESEDDGRKTYQNSLRGFIEEAIDCQHYEWAWTATIALFKSDKSNVELSLECLRLGCDIANKAESEYWEAETYFVIIETLSRNDASEQAVELYKEFKNKGLTFESDPLKRSRLASRIVSSLRKLGQREAAQEERIHLLTPSDRQEISARQEEELRSRAADISRQLEEQEQELTQRLADLAKQTVDKQQEVDQLQQEITRLQEKGSKLVEKVNRQSDQNQELRQNFLFLKSRTEFLAWLAGLGTLVAVLSGLIWWLDKKFRKQSNELKETEKNVGELSMKLARMKRMDSLGLMAGSIAHDFNNILVGVSGNAELIELSRDLGTFSEDYALDRVAAIKVSASRAQKLAKQMLNYAGKQYIAQKTIDLNELVAGYEAVMSSFSRKDHRVLIEASEEPLIVKVDETQIEQALFNLVTNAIHASASGSRVWVRTSRVSLSDDDMADPSIFGSRQTGGEFCCIEIEDEGCGIAPHQLDKIFEPYFSESGNGRGLGLAVVHGVIDSHNGVIRCTSKYGKGAKFQILLPLTQKIEEDSIDSYLPTAKPKLDEAQAGKRVLIIDDEVSVIDTCEQLLTQLGLTADSVWVRGEKCIDKILDKLAEEPFDCILMDVVMPELIGTQILDVLEDREITTPVVLMSGFSPERLDFYQKRKSIASILPKPFGIPDLVQSILKALTEDGSLERRDPETPSPRPHEAKSRNRGIKN